MSTLGLTPKVVHPYLYPCSLLLRVPSSCYNALNPVSNSKLSQPWFFPFPL